MEGKEAVIPASRRPDGTWRKERKVKAGYVPQEEVRVFETVASKMKSEPKRIPGLAPQQPADKVHQKPKPKKETNQSEIKKETDMVSHLASNLEKTKLDGEAGTDCDDPAKKLRKLKKKLREIDELQSKLTSGELQVSPEIELKIAKRELLLGEISELEELK